MRVAEFGSYEKPEVRVIVNIAVAEFKNEALATLDLRLGKNGLNSRIEFLSDILDHEWYALRNRHFEYFEVFLIREFLDLDAALGVHLADPLVSLSLWVNVKRPSARLECNDCVFNREIVRWEELLVPLTDLDGVAESISKRESSRVWNLFLLTLLHPHYSEFISQDWVKRTEIGNHTCGDQDITSEVDVNFRQDFRLELPTGLFTTETRNELFGSFEFDLALFDFIIEIFLFAVKLVQVVLQFCDFVLDFLQLSLSHFEFARDLFVLGLSNCKLLSLGDDD